MKLWLVLAIFGHISGWWINKADFRSEGLTAKREVGEVDGDVVLFTGQFAGVALQVVPVAGVLSHPLNLVAAVGFGRQLWKAALGEQTWTSR